MGLGLTRQLPTWSILLQRWGQTPSANGYCSQRSSVSMEEEESFSLWQVTPHSHQTSLRRLMIQLVIFVDPCLRRGLKALRTPSMSDLTPPGGVSVIDVDYSMNQQDSSVRGVVSTTFDSVGLQTPPPSDMEEKSLGSTDTSGLHTLSLHRMGQGTMGEEEVSKLYQSAEAQL